MVSVLGEFTDVQTAVNSAIKRYILNYALDKIAELSDVNKKMEEKYESTFFEFNEKISTDEIFVQNLELERQIQNWEDDLITWEFTMIAIQDWKKKLALILPA